MRPLLPLPLSENLYIIKKVVEEYFIDYIHLRSWKKYFYKLATRTLKRKILNKNFLLLLLLFSSPQLHLG
jgi:hypothetical protein